MIKEFQDEYRWLSNFYPVPIVYKGIEYPSTEHAYMSAKSHDPEWKEFCRTEPKAGKVKRASRDIKLRSDWEAVKVYVMKAVLIKKFEQEPFRQWLLDTGEVYIQEGNHHKDEFWGVNLATGKGSNWLGVLIMCVRDELREEND